MSNSEGIDEAATIFVKHIHKLMGHAMLTHCLANDAEPTTKQRFLMKKDNLTTRELGEFFFEIGWLPVLQIEPGSNSKGLKEWIGRNQR